MSTATFSPCGLYRYTLTRALPQVVSFRRPCLFIMLNPSDADATKNDPTIRRCIGFAKREGCTALTVVNLFALRATDPAELERHADPLGPDNARHIWDQLDAHRFALRVAAWGAHPKARGQVSTCASIADAGAMCLGMTRDGSPRHPLYVKGDAPLVKWAGYRP